jgi:hypothetical protein
VVRKVEDRGAAAQRLAIRLAKHDTAAGGNHRSGVAQQLRNDLLFEVAKGLLAFALEVLADGAADAALDLMVRVGEAPAQAACEMLADGRLPAAGHRNQSDRLSHGEFSRGARPPGPPRQLPDVPGMLCSVRMT